MKNRFPMNWTTRLTFLAFVGCGDGYSTQEAVALCDIDRENLLSVTEASYQQCITCYETCGDLCHAKGTTPEQYVCEE